MWGDPVSTLKEMAQEYRKAAAVLAIRIRDKDSAGAGKEELDQLREALRDIREIQRLLSGYYDIPRAEGVSAAGWRARGASKDDH